MSRKDSRPFADREYVTVPECVVWLGLGRRTIDDRIETGRFKVTLDGIRRKINVRSVLADLNTEATQQAA